MVMFLHASGKATEKLISVVLAIDFGSDTDDSGPCGIGGKGDTKAVSHGVARGRLF